MPSTGSISSLRHDSVMGIIKRKLMVMHRTQPEAPAEILAFLVCLAEVTFLAAWTLEPTVPALLPSATELTWLFGTEAAVSTLDPYLAPTFREHPAQNGQRVFLCVFSAKEDSNYHFHHALNRNLIEMQRLYLEIKSQGSQERPLRPWLVWLSGLSTSLQTKRSPVQFPVRAHA